jgi:FAD:protein FMN transferase
MKYRYVESLFVWLFILLLVTSCSDEKSFEHISGYTMGTSFNIKYSNPSVNKSELKKDVAKLLKEFDSELSNWNEQSWVIKFNHSKKEELVTVPDHAADVLEQCMELYEKSGGYFDVSISPLLEAWGFGSKNLKQVPKKSLVENILKSIGCDKLRFSKEKKVISKNIDGLQINCSAVAKGYGVDLVVKLLKEKYKVKYYLVEIGGEVSGSTKEDGNSWKIGIPVPAQEGSDQIEKVVELNNISMATSGDYNNFFKIEGKTYQHIINPKTGYPVSHNLCSVSILAPNCALADGLATACLVLGTQKGMKLLKKYTNCRGIFIERLSPGKYKSINSD